MTPAAGTRRATKVAEHETFGRGRGRWPSSGSAGGRGNGAPPQAVPASTSTAPTAPRTPSRSPPIAMPTAAAQSGSVPSSRLTRDGEVRRTDHICTKKAKSVQKTERNSSPPHSRRPNPAATVHGASPVPGTAASTAKTATALPSWTVVSDSESAPRTDSMRAISSTCTVRARAATSISRSPGDGLVNPPPWVSSTTPATESAAAARKAPGGGTRVTAPSASRVKIMVRLMMRPALVAEVCTTPYVSTRKTALRTSPSRPAPRHCAASSARSLRRPTTTSTGSTTANRSTSTATTVWAVVMPLAAR